MPLTRTQTKAMEEQLKQMMQMLSIQNKEAEKRRQEDKDEAEKRRQEDKDEAEKRRQEDEKKRQEEKEQEEKRRQDERREDKEEAERRRQEYEKLGTRLDELESKIRNAPAHNISALPPKHQHKQPEDIAAFNKLIQSLSGPKTQGMSLMEMLNDSQQQDEARAQMIGSASPNLTNLHNAAAAEGDLAQQQKIEMFNKMMYAASVHSTMRTSPNLDIGLQQSRELLNRPEAKAILQGDEQIEGMSVSDMPEFCDPAILVAREIRKRYTIEELHKLREAPLSQKKPDFFDTAEISLSIFDPDKWNLDRKKPEAAPENGPRTGDTADHRRRPGDPRERIRKENDGIVLSPQRRSFDSGCFVPVRDTTRTNRPHSPLGGSVVGNTSGGPKETPHIAVREIQPGTRRIGSGRIVRDWDYNEKAADSGENDFSYNRGGQPQRNNNNNNNERYEWGDDGFNQGAKMELSANEPDRKIEELNAMVKELSIDNEELAGTPNFEFKSIPRVEIHVDDRTIALDSLCVEQTSLKSISSEKKTLNQPKSLPVLKDVLLHCEKKKTVSENSGRSSPDADALTETELSDWARDEAGSEEFDLHFDNHVPNKPLAKLAEPEDQSQSHVCGKKVVETKNPMCNLDNIEFMDTGTETSSDEGVADSQNGYELLKDEYELADSLNPSINEVVEAKNIAVNTGYCVLANESNNFGGQVIDLQPSDLAAMLRHKQINNEPEEDSLLIVETGTTTEENTCSDSTVKNVTELALENGSVKQRLEEKLAQVKAEQALLQKASFDEHCQRLQSKVEFGNAKDSIDVRKLRRKSKDVPSVDPPIIKPPLIPTTPDVLYKKEVIKKERDVNQKLIQEMVLNTERRNSWLYSNDTLNKKKTSSFRRSKSGDSEKNLTCKSTNDIKCNESVEDALKICKSDPNLLDTDGVKLAAKKGKPKDRERRKSITKMFTTLFGGKNKSPTAGAKGLFGKVSPDDVVYRIRRNQRSKLKVVHLDRLMKYQGDLDLISDRDDQN